MKKLWVKSTPWNKKVITTALESGVDALLVAKGDTDKVKKLGLIKTIAEDGDLIIGKDVIEWEIKGKQDEEKIKQLSKDKIVIVKTKDWTIIPLENLIAQTDNLIVEVKNFKEAQTALTILEKGVDGVLLDTTDLAEIKKTATAVKEGIEQVPLTTAKILRIESKGLGDRVCIDTCTNMKTGEGMLIGSSSSALFLIHSESIENPYVEPRPFRVNAGPVHAYIKIPGGKTKYLSELHTGDEALIINYQGKSETAIVGRVKVEKRPLLFIEAEVNGTIISNIVQNAETIRLTKPDGSPISVIDLKKGSEILVYIEKAGRHFGMKVDETIVEK